MTKDLLTRIQQETHERLRELRDAVDEHDRLQAELRAIDSAPGIDSEPRVVPERHAELDIEPKSPAAPVPGLVRLPDPEPHTAPEAVRESPIDPEPPVNVRLPITPHLPRTRMVSPKVARLMRAPRRPALERAGVARVGAGRLEAATDEPVDEIDAELSLFECSL